MTQDYSQDVLDDLALYLRSISSDLSHLIQADRKIQSKLTAFPERGLEYEEVAEEVGSTLREAGELLDSAENPEKESREEQLYRMYRKHGKVPEIPASGSWRDFYSEAEVIDNERDSNVDAADSDILDYRPLLRAHNNAILTLISASQYDRDLIEYLPEIEGDDAEIIDETEKTLDGEVKSTSVLEHQREGLKPENRHSSDHLSFSFLGEISLDEEKTE